MRAHFEDPFPNTQWDYYEFTDVYRQNEPSMEVNMPVPSGLFEIDLPYPTVLHVWYIYLHLAAKFMVNL